MGVIRLMKYKWVDIKEELPTVGNSVNMKFRTDVPEAEIKIGDTLEVTVTKIYGHGIDMKHNQDFILKAALEDFSHWQKEIPVPINNRWELLDL